MIDILYAPLPYEARLPERSPGDVDLLVIHCTELPDLGMAREYGERVLYEDRGTGASGHYYIDRDGTTLCYVDPHRTANHTRGYNPRSIGIELVNLGRYPDWFRSDNQVMTEPYPDTQVDALVALVAQLMTRFPTLRLVAGHEDLDLARVPASDAPGREVPRKRDPGPMFPWDRLLADLPLTRITAAPPL
ncbi:N-acetylmuramoyl-L-alanine amidase [Luteibacter sp. PPL201]|uniref:N-acetylmuramoyl-L-alanine amidase n=1 Tax=Luteibacter sahnii TaxID=3021977 RepID=A0ABT6B7X0_9GAMM|nr:N-acetylmuramoyl-L-alanine amidase [Luteibacter sp. PPL193]MDY1547909.1 N-acetylmuramoyl-L-alanine amidase [Luteibacter sp. PPL193]